MRHHAAKLLLLPALVISALFLGAPMVTLASAGSPTTTLARRLRSASISGATRARISSGARVPSLSSARSAAMGLSWCSQSRLSTSAAKLASMLLRASAQASWVDRCSAATVWTKFSFR